MRIAKDDPIIIIGGGIAGITTALSLQFHEFTNIHIYEKSASLIVPEVPVQLGANILTSLSDLTLSEVVKAASKPWTQLVWKRPDGKLLKEVDLSGIGGENDFTPVNITFPELHKILRRELSDSVFHLGQELISYTLGENTIEAHFADGQTTEGAILIGADGLNSRVRLQMMGRREIRKDGRWGYHALLDRGLLDYPDHEVFAKPQVEFWGPGKLCVLSAQSELQAGISLYLENPSLAPQSTTEWLKNEFKDWENPIPETIAQVEDAHWQAYEVADIEPMKNWTDWRVVLVGDAAHASFPYIGQSIGMTIESGMALARALNENMKKIERAFKKYEKLRASRTKTAIKAAWERSESLGVDGKITYALRNAIMPKLPGFLEEKAFLKLQKGNYYNK